MTVINQDDVVQFITNTKCAGGICRDRIDTHISTVFLTDDQAWKLKKAVRFPFLDFSTPQLRRRACERELELNRLWAPSLYLGLNRITRQSDGSLAWDGNGDEVDCVVVMQRFPDDAGLAQLLAQDQVDRKQMAGLVQTLWRGYGLAKIHYAAEESQGIGQIIDGLEASFPAPIPGHLFRLWRQQCGRWQDRLDQRRQDGWVRRCHGDLHLGNICRFQGELIPFDVLEFNESLAIIDVAYDMAFLMMDLLAHGSADYAALVMNRYLDVSGDYGCVALLPLFVSLRAGVRAMVMRTQNRHDQAQMYERLAVQALTAPQPRLVAVGGLSGSGKSRLSSRLSPRLGVPGAAVIRSDAIRKRLMGVDQTTKLPPEGYDPQITQRVYAALSDACRQIRADGLPVIADAVFSRPEERDAIAQCGQPFTGLWLEAPFEVAASRVQNRTADASDATVSVLEHQHQRDVGPITWPCIETSGPGERTVERAMALLSL